MFAYGGAGPLHAVDVARELGIAKVIIPPMPGHFSAYGMLLTSLRRDYAYTHIMRFSAADLPPGNGSADGWKRKAATPCGRCRSN